MTLGHPMKIIIDAAVAVKAKVLCLHGTDGMLERITPGKRGDPGF